MVSALIFGLISGSLYGLTGMGLVVIYRVSRLLNFSLGSAGGLAAYVVLALMGNLPYWLVFAIAVLVGGAVSGLTNLLLRPLRGRPHLTVGIATLGFLLFVQGLVEWHWGSSIRALPIPFGQHVIRAGPVDVSEFGIYTVVIAGAVALLVFAFIFLTRAGLGMRAVSAGPLTSGLMGIRRGPLELTAWVVAGGCGAVAALLVIPTSSLSPTSFTSYMILAFTAIVLGGFTSIPGVLVGGVVVGIITNLLALYLSATLINTYTFVIVLAILMLRPNGILGAREHSVIEPRLPRLRWTPRPLRRLPPRRTQSSVALTSPQYATCPAVLAGRIRHNTTLFRYPIALVCLAVLPLVVGTSLLNLLPQLIASYIVILGLNVTTEISGQLSIGQGAFMAVGAYVTAVCSHHLGISTIDTLPLTIVVAGGIGLILGTAVARLEGLYLALLTLVFALIVPEVATALKLTGGADGLSIKPPFGSFGLRDQYWIGLVLAALATGATLVVIRSSVGRMWRAVRDSPDGAAALGISPKLARATAFALGAGLAGLGGALSAAYVGFVSPDGYTVFLSAYLLIGLVVGGAFPVFGSLVGAAFYVLVPFYGGQSGFPPDAILGLALLVVIYAAPGGVSALSISVGSAIVRAVRRAPRDHQIDLPNEITIAPRTNGQTRAGSAEPAAHISVGGRPSRPSDHAPTGGAHGLLVDGLEAGYGSVPVLHSVSLQVGVGQVVALLGGNGAGKSTVLRTISGLLVNSGGSITWDDHPLDGVGADAIARSGITHVPEGRGIFPDLSVRENLRLSQFSEPGARSTDPAGALDLVTAIFPKIPKLMSRRAGTLSGGEQQMVAVGRALMCSPKLLLLDEPTLGLAPVLVGELFEALARVKETGMSILVVEQNASVALKLCDYAYVMASGSIVVDGLADELRDDSRLFSAYLGGTA